MKRFRGFEPPYNCALIEDLASYLAVVQYECGTVQIAGLYWVAQFFSLQNDK